MGSKGGWRDTSAGAGTEHRGTDMARRGTGQHGRTSVPRPDHPGRAAGVPPAPQPGWRVDSVPQPQPLQNPGLQAALARKPLREHGLSHTGPHCPGSIPLTWPTGWGLRTSWVPGVPGRRRTSNLPQGHPGHVQLLPKCPSPCPHPLPSHGCSRGS